MARKTVDLQALVNTANGILAYPQMNPEFRSGVCLLLEHALMDSKNYGGFSYLNQNDLPQGDLPGIRVGPNGEALEFLEAFDNVDDTRRHYRLKKVS